MSAGTQAAGQGNAGFTVQPTIARDPIVRVRARKYDPQQQRFIVKENGQYEDEHPVDQWVKLQLGIIRGTILSAATVGNPGLALTHLTDNFVVTTTEAIQRQLQQKVLSGEIRVESIRVTRLKRSGVAIEVNYTNLVLSNSPIRPVTLRNG